MGCIFRLRLYQIFRYDSGVFVIDNGWADFIGNDWQSSRNARQGFLDYVLADQRRYAEMARVQFSQATAKLLNTEFVILVGIPAETLCEFVKREQREVLVAGKQIYQCCGRPSVTKLTQKLARRLTIPVYVVD